MNLVNIKEEREANRRKPTSFYISQKAQNVLRQACWEARVSRSKIVEYLILTHLCPKPEEDEQ